MAQTRAAGYAIRVGSITNAVLLGALWRLLVKVILLYKE
jgi:hypothetical protein